MENSDYRHFLDLLMCSDPWPILDDDDVSQVAILDMANRGAQSRSFDNWVDAYHKFKGE